MATYNRPTSSSLAASSSKPTTSSSLRNAVHRKRSASSSDDDSSAAIPSDDSPVVKKGRYERKELTGGLLGKALDGVVSQSAPSTPSTSAHRLPAKPVDSLSTPRSQFEQQEDFISFGFDDEPSSSRSSRKPAKTAIPSSAGGRVLDQYETKQEEHSKRVQKREKGRTTPWCEDPGVDWSSCTSAIDMLNKEAHAFITYISPTPIEHQLRMWSVELIRRAIKSRWADAEVECFGSVGTGLYLPGGDIDLVVLCPSFPSPPLKPTSSLLHSLASLLLTTSLADPSSLLVIAKSRVPIVKFTTRHGGFAVDLSVNQKNGVDAATGVRQLLEDYSFRLPDHVEHGSTDNKKEQEKEEETEEGEVESLIVDHGVARSLVLLVKAFLNQRGMNEVFTGGLGSYSIICLVVSFLQLHPKIQTGVIHPAHNIGLLLVEFLEYYGKHFNFDEAGISLRKNGGYFNKHNKGWWRQNQPYLLSIEDPNDPSNDVSGGSHNIIRVRQTMAGAFEVLAATLCQRSSAFSLSNPSATSNTSYELSRTALPTADPTATSSLRQSVLGGILGISLPSLKSREDNIDLFNEGILQDLIERGTVEEVGMSKKGQRKLIKEEKAKRTREKTLRKLEGRQKEREEKIAAKEKRKRAAEEEEEFIVENPATKLFASKAASTTTKPKGGDDLFMIDTEPSDSRYSINSPAPASKSTTAATEVIYINDGDSGDDSDFSSIAGAGAGGRDSDVIMGGADSGDKISSGVPSKASSIIDTEDSDESEDDDDAVSVSLRPATTATSNGTTPKKLSSKAKKHAIRLARKQEKARKAAEEEVTNPGAAEKAIAAGKVKKAKKAEKKAEKKAKYWAAKGEVLPPVEP